MKKKRKIKHPPKCMLYKCQRHVLRPPESKCLQVLGDIRPKYKCKCMSIVDGNPQSTVVIRELSFVKSFNITSKTNH